MIKKKKIIYYYFVGFAALGAVVDEVGCYCAVSPAGAGLLQQGNVIYAPRGKVFTRANQANFIICMMYDFFYFRKCDFFFFFPLKKMGKESNFN